MKEVSIAFGDFITSFSPHSMISLKSYIKQAKECFISGIQTSRSGLKKKIKRDCVSSTHSQPTVNPQSTHFLLFGYHDDFVMFDKLHKIFSPLKMLVANIKKFFKATMNGCLNDFLA